MTDEITPDDEMYNLRVIGDVYPAGSGSAVVLNLPIGDGFPPAIVMRLSDDDGTVVVNLTVGGFNALETMDASLKDLARFLQDVVTSLMQDGMDDVPDDAAALSEYLDE